MLAADERNESTVAVLVAREPWAADTSASLRRAIADDKERAMWVHVNTGEVFAPYDGGVDLIFSSAERRDAARWRLSAWLSPLPSGL